MKLLLLITTLLHLCLVSKAESKIPEITHSFFKLNNEEELSTFAAYSIAQDLDGFMWIGTSDGLNRYDGNDYKIYRHVASDKQASLTSNVINALFLDSKGTLWVGTDKGLNYYDKNKDIFIPFVPANGINDSIKGANVFDISEDSAGNLWIYNRVEIFIVSSDLSNIRHIKIKSDINTILILSPDEVIVASYDDGVFALDLSSGLRSKEKISDLIIFKFFKTQNGKLILGSNSGLYITDFDSFKKGRIGRKYIEGANVSDIEEFSSNQFIVTSQNNGVFIISDKGKLLSHHVNSASNETSISSNKAYSVFKDTDKNFWFTTNLGINIIKNNGNAIRLFRSNDTSSLCLSSNEIYSILYDSQDYLWIGSSGSALHRINLLNGQCTSFKSVQRTNNEFSTSEISALHEHKKKIWIGTFRNGLITYDLESKKFEWLNDLIKAPLVNQIKMVTKISSYRDKVWISTRYQGIFVIDTSTKSIENFKLYFDNNQSKPVSTILGVFIENEAVAWVATENNGLWKFSVPNKEFIAVAENNSSAFYNAGYFSIDGLSPGKLIANSRTQGMYLYDYKNNTVKNYSIENGLLNNAVMKTITDNDGDTWILTDKGISLLGSDLEIKQTFLEKDGLQADAFTPTAQYIPSKDMIITGGVNGFNIIYPKKLKKNNRKVKSYISELELQRKALSFSERKSQLDIEKPVRLLKEITFKHSQNVFGFTFSAIDYNKPELLKYWFRLKNYDEDWNKTSSKRRYASYTNIPPGDYVFQVRSSQSESWENSEIKELKVSILPPWWKTYWAYAAYSITALLLLYLFIGYRTKALEKRAKELELNVEKRTKELAEEKDKVEQLLSQKNEEFANISHEFRTPLTLVLGPIAQLLKRKHDSDELQKLNVVQRNGYRLLRMVDQLLNLETFRVKSITQRSPQAVSQIIQMLAEAFKDLAEEKSLTFKIKTIEQINFEFTPDAIEKITLNLLSNAIKYTPQGVIEVSATRQGKSYQITVLDTGIGIPENKSNSVFDRFNRVLDENSEKVTGAGIGLSLVKSLVESHGGEIDLKSEYGKGTKITVSLPIINEVDSITDKLDSNTEIVAMELMSLQSQDIQNFEAETEVLETSNKPCILVIEDNPDMRNYIGQSISDDYQVIMAEDGLDGLAKAKAQVPDLIISDVMMPRMDGYQTTNELRRDDITSHIPVLLLTARGDRESRLKGWYEKADEYITKPFDVEELKIRVNNLLEIRNILKKRFGETAFESISENKEAKTPEKLAVVSDEDLEENKTQLQQAFVDKLNTALEKLYQEPKLSVDELAGNIAMSQRQLFRKLKSILDMTPGEYIRRYRLEKSKLLLTSGKSANFTALEVGFSSQSYFSQCFKAQYGVSPSQFVKQL